MSGKKAHSEHLKELRETYLIGLNDGLGKGFEIGLQFKKKLHKGYEFA
jgi:hypothetical protein